LPPELAQLKALTSLDLQQNALGELPAVVCRLTSLTSLDLKGNSELASLPACIGDLAALEFLGLAFTFELRALPPEVTKLTRLKEISALESGFVKTSQLEALRAAMPTTRITGREEGQLLDQMQKMEAEGDRIQKEEDAARRKRLRVR
ncbi:MAG: leucine-rich repeat domain-containing protein, partial [Acidobacteria bacterium]|nr:leucine-rich repeat domain-containing protein [Acidobacteriota bacterium]